MIRYTNDVYDFFENNIGQICLWGAGNAGYFVGEFMNRCKMDFYCYLDESVEHEEVSCQGKPIYKPENIIKEGEYLRIIITPYEYYSILDQLAAFDWKVKNLEILCLIPKYRGVAAGFEHYNINSLLSYFRHKLINVPVPTFISDNCIAGHIYDLTDNVLLSPTINTGFSAEDYLRFCENYEHYMDCIPTNIHFEREFDQNEGVSMEYPVAYLDDIKVSFAHNYTPEDIPRKWKLLSDRCDKENIVFILSDYHHYLDLSLRKRFAKLPQKHYTILSRCGVIDSSIDIENSIYLKHYIFGWYDRAIENVFDLVGWINSMGDS